MHALSSTNPHPTFTHLRRILSLAWPIVCSSFISHAINLVGIAFVGRLGEFELSTALLAISFFNITGLALVVGFAGVLETMCGQAYGASNYRAVGLALQRAVILSLVLSTIITTVWQFAEPGLILLGQKPDIAAGAAIYLRLASPGLFCAAMYQLLMRYLLTQGQTKQPTVGAVIAGIAAPIYNYLLIFHFGLGLHGAALATDAVQGTQLLVLGLLTWRFNRRRTGTERQPWYGWSREAFSGLGPYIRIGGPSIAMVAMEWSAFEVCTVESGWLKDPEVALGVMGLLFNITTLLYMLPLGLSAANSARVSNTLGAGLPRAAQRAAVVAIAIGFVMQLTTALTLYFARIYVIGIFTNVATVIDKAAKTARIVSIAVLADGLNCTQNGMLRGSGRQALGASMSGTAYWVIALPIGYHMTFNMDMGVEGLWWGLVIGNYLLTSAGMTVLFTTDWEKQVRRARELHGGMESRTSLAIEQAREGITGLTEGLLDGDDQA